MGVQTRVLYHTAHTHTHTVVGGATLKYAWQSVAAGSLQLVQNNGELRIFRCICIGSFIVTAACQTETDNQPSNADY